MDPMDMCSSISSGENNESVKNRDWHKRLRLRKTTSRPPTMQGQDMPGPKKIEEEWGPNTDWRSAKMSHKAQQSQHRTNNSANILRFRCSQCQDNLECVPKELMRHFQEAHKGSLPVFPCHLCAFSAHEFSSLQVHLLSHMDSFSSCNICNDNVQRTLSEYCTHLTTCHSQNGKYSCEMCKKFSTGEVQVFLEHMHLHNMALEETGEVDLSVHTMDLIKQFALKATGHTFYCPYCGYEAPNKRLITKHMNTVHGGQTANQNIKEVHRVTKKPNESVSKIKHTVRDMRWLSQDCLSLPGREFLDRYCSLSDPERTLEETQQFLVRTASGETDNQKWTKALQSVLSSFPQDMNLHPKLESSIMSNSSKDLTVLTVKNKIKVSQNGGTYVKRVTPTEKVESIPSESAVANTHCALDPCAGAQNYVNNDSSVSAKTESAECSQTQENRENQELKVAQNGEEQGRKNEELKNRNSCVNETDASKEPKLASKQAGCSSTSKGRPKRRRRRRHWKRRTRPRAMDKRLEGFGLKLLLKKDPVKNKQWMSQSPLSPSGASAPGDPPHGTHPQTDLEATQPIFKAPKTDPHRTSPSITLSPRPHSADEFLAKSCGPIGTGSTDLSHDILVSSECAEALAGYQAEDGDTPVVLKMAQLANQVVVNETEKSAQLIGSEVAGGGSAGEPRPLECPSPRPTIPENAPHPDFAAPHGSSRGDVACVVSDMDTSSVLVDALSHQSNTATSAHFVQPFITPQASTPSEDPGLAFDAAQRSCPSSDRADETGQSCQEEPASTGVHRQRRIPRNVERTLKLVPLSPSQRVKRPLCEQPVVVLNHPDVDAPEVTNIMEAVHRHRGHVRKVVLSRRTLKAIADEEGASPPTPPPPPHPRGPAGLASAVRERFTLKLRLRRTSRRKYQVVRAASSSGEPATKYRCWFCGRVFLRQDAWLVHRQRHFYGLEGAKL